MVICFPWAKIKYITESVKKCVGPGKGGSRFIHVGTNNADRVGTNGIVREYRQLVKRAKQTRIEQIMLSLIIQVMGYRGQGYRNCRRMAIKMLVQQLWGRGSCICGFVGMCCWEG